MFMGITLFRLVTAALLPVLVTVGFYQAEKKSRFGKISNIWKQIIVGVTFGILAILATEFGIPHDGAVVNVRNAAPLTAGLIFGWPAGLIAGIVGAVQRWFSNAGDYTRLACSIGTLVAGIFGASVRKFMMDNKKASWFYGLAVGVTTEVLHMLLVFVTNADDMQRAFSVVKVCAVPMITANSLSVMVSIIVLTVLIKRGGKYEQNTRQKENITQTFQRWLLISVVLAFGVTMVFTSVFQTRLAYAVVENTLRNTVDDVCNDIRDASDQNLLTIVNVIADDVEEAFRVDWSLLSGLARRYMVQEINIVDSNGIITCSTDPEIVGYDMRSKEITAEFLTLLDGETEYVQPMRPNVHQGEDAWKFAAVAMSEDRILQIGCTAARFQRDIDEQAVFAARNRHIGQDGCVIICNQKGIIVSDREGREGESVSVFGDSPEELKENTVFRATLYDTPSLCMYTESEGYYILAVMSEEEALFAQTASIYILAFMELLVFAALFTNIFVLIKKLVVKNIRKINESLAQITDGNLNVTVDVRDNEEFASLSDDINLTVSALKSYIDEAAARFDKDLEIAKRIQHSALPSVFPPYPSRKDFSIFAS